MTSCGPEGANDYSPGCQPGVLDKNRFNSEAVAENTMASTLTNLLIHVVFSTKGREPIITDKYQGRLHAYIGGIIRSHGAQSLSIGGMPDHIHLVMKIRSNQALSELVRKIKANSSKWINENQFCRNKFSWQNGNGGFSVSASQINNVRNYIENQAEHHKSKTFKEELIEILDRHGVDYNPKYLWD
jgi:REP element-mobilizing transposase RayT